MSYTKRKIIEKAFSAVGLPSYVYDLTPEQMDDARTTLDTMIASWEALGIRLGYSLPSNPEDSDLDDESGLPDQAVMAVYMNLGMLLAAGIGKTVPLEISRQAKESLDALKLKSAANPPRVRRMAMPAGAGAKAVHDRRFLPATPAELTTGQDGPLTFE
jgi:hypothetical protein